MLNGCPFSWVPYPAEILCEGTYCECLFQYYRQKNEENVEPANRQG